MSPKTRSAQDLIPDGIDASQLQKGLGCAANLLGRCVPKRGNPDMKPGTRTKLLNTILVQMVAKMSPGAAQDLLDCFQEVVAKLCADILALPNPAAVLAQVAQLLTRKQPRAAFSVTPHTLSAHLDRFPAARADTTLREQLEAIREQMRRRGTWPKEVMLTADPTDAPYRGRFHNQWTSWGRVGNQPTWKRVFKEFGIYASPPQLQVGFAPVLAGAKGSKDLPAWVRNIRSAVEWLQSTGTGVPLVAMDREFYAALGFAVARLGLFAPTLPAGVQPRLLCPTRFWRAKIDPKWEFLVGKDPAAAREDTMELSVQDAARLGPAAARLASGANGKFLVPIAVVAGFDTYSGTREPKSLDWARAEAAHVDKHLREARATLEAATTAYKNLAKGPQGVARSLPTKRGRKRQSFGSDEEACWYGACLEAQSSVSKWEKKKESLLKRLVFFTASLQEGEHVAGRELEFLKLIQLYREHWGIENAYKSQKWQFRVRTSSRKTTARHVRAILGAIFYNAWQHRRVDRAARAAKESAPGWKPFNATSPPTRKKWEREIRPALSAQGYLLGELKLSLKISIKILLTQFI